MSIHIAIVNDCRLSSESLASILVPIPDLDVVGKADEWIPHGLNQDKQADILLLDSRMPGSLDRCREVSRNGGRPWTILLSADADDGWAVKALEAGARGVLSKEASSEELAKAIHVVHAGEIWAPKRVITRMAEELVALTAADQHKRAELSHRLSPREQEVVGHAANGLSNKEIADCLGTSQATIKAHLTHIFQKLGLRDRVELAAHYHRAVSSSPSCSSMEFLSARGLPVTAAARAPLTS